jgi:hypothetical protein
VKVDLLRLISEVQTASPQVRVCSGAAQKPIFVNSGMQNHLNSDRMTNSRPHFLHACRWKGSGEFKCSLETVEGDVIFLGDESSGSTRSDL